MTEQAEHSQWKPLYVPAITERLLAKENCEKIIAAANETGFKPVRVHDGGRDDVYQIDPTIRSTGGVALDPVVHSNVYDFATQTITRVNNEQYRFGLVGIEPIQVLRYTEGCFYWEHSDMGYDYGYAARRKVTLVVQLSEGGSYEGGRLVLFGEQEAPRAQGSTFVFPSWLPHRVDEVTAGTRYSLAVWATGPPFT